MKKFTILACVMIAVAGCGKEDTPKVGEGPDDGQPNNASDMGLDSGGGSQDTGSPDLGAPDGSSPDTAQPDDMAQDAGSDTGGDGGMDAGEDMAPDMMDQSCGNGVLDAMEDCDPAIAAGLPGACPTDCDDGRICTTATLVGTAADCTARCMPGAPVCADGDSCCAGAPCDITNDTECFVPAGTTVANHAFTGPSNLAIGHVELGPNNRKFVAGTFQGTVQLDATTTLTPVNSYAAAWVAELDANNNVVWVTTASSDGLAAVNAMDYDPANDELVVAIGTLGETALTLGGSTYNVDLLNDFVVAKLDAANNGTVDWVNVYANPERQIGYAVEIAPDGSIWVAGGFQGTLDFGSGAVTADDWDMFLVKLDTDGAPLDDWTWGSPMADFLQSLVVFDDGSAAAFGTTTGMIDFGGGAVMPVPNTTLSTFVGVRLDASGNHSWSRSFEVLGGVSDAAILANGNIAVVGRSRGNPNFGDGAQNGRGGNDIVVGLLDASNGDGLRTAVAGGPGNDYATAVAVTFGGINVVGQTEGGTDFFGNMFTPPGGDSDAFVARYSSTAADAWFRVWGGPGEENATDVAVDATYGVFVTGTHRSAIDLGLGVLPYDANVDTYCAELAP